MREPYALDRTSDIITEINVSTNQGTYKIHQQSIINLLLVWIKKRERYMANGGQEETQDTLNTEIEAKTKR